MKKLMIMLLFLFAAGSLEASLSYKVDKLTADSVPQAVKEAFSKDFQHGKVVRWEQHTTRGKRHEAGKYVCIFDDAGKIRSRARYRANGKGISATQYYGKRQIKDMPQGIQASCADKFPGYKIMMIEKEIALKSGLSAYRIKLRKGFTKVFLWLDESGREITAKNLKQEWRESESES